MRSRRSCHDSGLETAAGETISKDCSQCHVILSQEAEVATSIAPSGVEFAHPVDVDGDEFYLNCTECHEGGSELY